MFGTPPGTTWASVVGGEPSERASAVVRTEDGGFLLAGASQGRTPTGWAARLGPRGTVQWELTYPVEGPPPRPGTFTSAVGTADGGFLLAGWVRSARGSDRNGWLVKVDATGAVQFAESYDPSPQADDEFHAAEPLPGGGALLAGLADVDQPRRSADGWAVRASADGDEQWSRRYVAPDSGEGPGQFDALRAVAPAPDGGYVLAGETDEAGPGGDAAAWAVRVATASGDATWNRAYDRPGDDRFAAAALVDDTVLLAGEGAAGGRVVGVAGDGAVRWRRSFDGGAFEGGAAAGDGAVFVGALANDGWAVRLDDGGTLRWGARYDASSSDALHAAASTGEDDGAVLAGETANATGPGSDAWALQVGPPVLTPTPTPTGTPTPTPTATPTPTPTATPTATPTGSPIPSPTGTPTSTDASPATATPSPAPATTPTSTISPTPTDAVEATVTELTGTPTDRVGSAGRVGGVLQAYWPTVGVAAAIALAPLVARRRR